MPLSFLKSIAASLLVGISFHVNAGGLGEVLMDAQKISDEGQTSSVLTIDNDSLLLKRDDGFYTSGLRFAQSYSLRVDNELTAFGWRIGQDLYTASDIKLPPTRVGPPDHPYAAWLYAGVFKESQNTDGAAYQMGLDLGCLGPCAGGERTQTALHRALGQPLPRGWSRQVSNEAGVVMYADVVPVRWTLSPTVDVSPALHARFGNIHTDASVSVIVRAGQLNTLADQPTMHGFVRLDGRAVGYNATMQGGYFTDNNVHTMKPKRFVGEIELGVVWSREHYAIMASVLRRGNEIADLSNAVGAQNFARLQFSYTP